jgi:LysM repeat protein
MSLGTTLALLGLAGVGAFAAYKFGLFGAIKNGAGTVWDGIKNVWSAVGGWKFALGTAAALFIGKKLGGTKGLLIAGALAAAVGGFLWWKHHKEEQEKAAQIAAANQATPGVPGSEVASDLSSKSPGAPGSKSISGPSVERVDGPDQPTIAGAKPLTPVTDVPANLGKDAKTLATMTDAADPKAVRGDGIPFGDQKALKAMTDDSKAQVVADKKPGGPVTVTSDSTASPIQITKGPIVAPKKVGLSDQLAASTGSKAPKAPVVASATQPYDVVAGDSLSQIAWSRGMTVSQLLQTRGPTGETNADLLAKSSRGDFDPDLIYPGQRMYLPTSSSKAPISAKAPISLADGGR